MSTYKTLQELTLKDNFMFSAVMSDPQNCREMEERFMTLNELLRDERREGHSEGRREGLAEGHKLGQKEGLSQGLTQGISLSILEFLSVFGTVPQSLADRIRSQTDPEVLRQWLALAFNSGSLEEFKERI